MKRALLMALAFASFVLAETVNYTYDEAGRLIRAQYGSGTVISYTYDKNGNLLSRVVERPEAASPSVAAKKSGSKKTRGGGKSR